MMRAVRQAQELGLAAAQVRGFVALPRLDFTEEVAAPKPTVRGDAVPALDDIQAKKASTQQLMKLLHTYKDLGDNKNEPLLKFHNPRTFEDLSKPVPNFRAMNLKAGEVPKFFDSVLMRRAEESVAQKNQWWEQRKKEAEDTVKGKAFQPFATVAVPSWKYGSSVSLDNLKSVTDTYVKKLEPKRKLKVPALPAEVKQSLAAFVKQIKQEKSLPEVTQMLVAALAEKAVVEEDGKVVDGFKFVSKAVAAKVIAERRAQVHDRYLKYWAKKVVVSPEQAVVPLKEVDYQLASKFEGVAPQYSELLSAVSAGPKTLGERISESPAFTKFLLKREKAAVVNDFPASDVDKEGAALAKKLEDPQAALEQLLGPELKTLGAAGVPLSEQVRAITAHKYAPDRYFYKEGMKLADKLAEEEKALAAELKPVYGDAVDVAKFQVHPRTIAQQIADRQIELEKRGAELEAAKAAAATPYEQYTLTKKHDFLKDLSNLEFEEVMHPQLVQESMDLELAELREAELAIDDAEEEELWALTLAAQLKHLQKHFGVDLPQSVLAYMDPILVKKIDFETTHSLDDWDAVLEDVGGEYAKEQWGMEALSHHFLPLIRYRRAKARRAGIKFDNETAAVVRH